MTIEIRKAAVNDCKDLFKWRNDPFARKMSFNSEELSYEEHENWFKKSLQNPDRVIYIAENENGESVGHVRLDRNANDIWEFDINVKNNERGKGFATNMINTACIKQGAKYYLARIKEENIASIKSFLRAGFLRLLDYDDKNCGKVIVLGRLEK